MKIGDLVKDAHHLGELDGAAGLIIKVYDIDETPPSVLVQWNYEESTYTRWVSQDDLEVISESRL